MPDIGAMVRRLVRGRRVPPVPPDAPPSAGGDTAVSPGAPGAVDARLLADVAAGLWRVRGKMTDRVTGEPHEQTRHLFRHVQAVCDTLAEAGVEIQDHDGVRYDPGLSMTVVAFQPTPGLARETVIETIKPTVYLNGRVLCLGEVVVGAPAATPTATSAPGRGTLPGDKGEE